jgi:hypothetical protein
MELQVVKFPTITAEHWRIAFNRKENNNIKEKLRNIMNEKDNQPELPTSLAGYQCVESGITELGDICVLRGKPWCFVDRGHPIIPASDESNIYRKMPVATNLGEGTVCGLPGLDKRLDAILSSATRKQRPVASGVLDYFPDALMEVAYCSYMGNEQHNKGKPLHWDRSKSGDEADALIRHFLERGKVDSDGVRHSAKLAWRSLSLLQKEIENAKNPTP